MIELIVSIAMTIVIYVAGFLFLRKKPLFCKDEKKFRTTLCKAGFINTLLWIICSVWIFLCTTPKGTFIVLAAVVITLLIFSAFAVAPFLPKETTKKLLKRCAVLCIIPLFLELFVFNAKSIDLRQQEYPTGAIVTETPEHVQINGDSIYFSGDGSIDINMEQAGPKAVEIEFSGTDDWFKCTTAMKDGNYGTKFITVGETYSSASYAYSSFAFEPYENLKSFRIALSGVDGSVHINSIKFSSALPFEFSNLRFFGLSAIGIIIYLIYHFKLYKIIYNSKSVRHSYVIGAVLLLCVLSALPFVMPNQTMIDYKTANIPASDPYVQMFDAVNKGQVNIDIPVSPGLEAMENPYDWQQRIDSGISYAWDRAYFEGEYYSYFGIVPVFVLYFPFYFITGMLPTLNITISIFSILSIVFLLLTILTLVKMFVKKPNFLMLLLGLVSSVFCSGLYYALDFTDIYFPAKVSGICFMLLCVWLGLLAYNARSNIKKQYILLAASGLSFILCVGCRPSVALSALVLAPAFICILADKEYSIQRKIGCICSFIAPVIIGGAALLWYNYARFGSPFDFGAAYQLTVSNIGANSMRLGELPAAIIHYFLQPFAFASEFPFFKVQTMPLNNYGHYVYNDNFFGVINFPSVFSGLIISICLLVKGRKKEHRLTMNNNLKYFTYFAIVLLSFFIAWSDFCLAGVAFGYMLDILPLLAILSVLVYLNIQERFSKTAAIQNKITGTVSVLMVLSMVIVFLHLLTYTNQNLFLRFPNIRFILENLVVFWN